MHTEQPSDHKRLGLALGSGSARGIAHVGVIQRLVELGIRPDVICGASVGALVGACHACDKLDAFAEWVSNLSRSEILHYMEPRLLATGGVAHGGRLIAFFKENYGNPDIRDLPLSFAAVATDLHRGREAWLQSGPVWDAVRASISIPGLLTPVAHGKHWLVDGGLVNPVPVSVCRALGANTVIAVNLNSDLVGRKLLPPKPDKPGMALAEDLDAQLAAKAEESDEFSTLGRVASSLRGAASNLWSRGSKRQPPGAFNVMLSAINIMQDRITRSRLAGEPADVYLAPRLGDVGLLEFSRAAEAIEEGRATVDRLLPEIQYALEMGEDLLNLDAGETRPG